MPRVSALWTYPIKGCRGVPVQTLPFDELGPRHDRRLMLVDDDGVFLSQREDPELGQIGVVIDDRSLRVTHARHDTLEFNLDETGGRRRVQVWGFEGDAELIDAGASEWFSAVLGRRCHLVRLAPDVPRMVSQRYTNLTARLGFADAYPALLTATASLEELNRRLTTPVEMERFRPNIVVSDLNAFEEDTWRRLSIDGLTLDVVKPCDRCVVTTRDPATGASGKEPLRTLATFRRAAGAVYFGQNVVHHGPGALSVGSNIRVASTGPSNLPFDDSP